MRILVAGASGGIGQAVVDIAHEFGHEVFAVSRSPIRQHVWRKIEVDIFNSAAVMMAMESGIDAVISCIGMQRRNPANPWSRATSPVNLTSEAARLLCGSMQHAGVSRIIAVSAAGVAESEAQLNMVMKVMLATTMIGTAYADLARMEHVLATSGLDWLAPRPTRLIDGESIRRVRVTNRFATNDAIRRRDVAWWMVDALSASHWPLPEWGSRTPQITAD